MKSKILALCDTEEEYAQHMTEYLKSRKEAPWELHTYTNAEGLEKLAENTDIELLVVAENAYTEAIRRLPAAKTILLNESGVMRWENVRNVNKYQQAENVYREILNAYMDVAKEPLLRLAVDSDTRLVGLFSPIHRCLQTTFALTLGQMLSQKYRTLYLSFEQYAGIPELLPDTRTRDLTDLIFFLNTDKDRFLLRMQTMILKKGQMDYIPPARAGMNLLEVSGAEWLELLKLIAESGEYEYIILDLTESVQGILDILRMCCRIYTLVKDDRAARGKLAQYERLLALSEYEDVLAKTSQYKLPRFRKLPDEVELLTKGELADYVRGIVKEVTE